MEHKFKVKVPNGHKVFLDNSLVISTVHLNLWREVAEDFSRISFPIGDGKITVAAYWNNNNTLDRIINNIKQDILLETSGKPSPEMFFEDTDQNYEIEFSVKVHSNKPVDSVKTYFDNFLYSMFLAFNLSAPSSFSVKDWSSKNVSFGINELDGTLLEGVWLVGITNNWPSIVGIPINRTWDWIVNLQIAQKQLAVSNTEKALFAFIHACKCSPTDPASLIWLAHALEALYDTPSNAVTKTLQDRICIFLSEKILNVKEFKKSIRKFYELRSRFVHGDLEIPLPTLNETLDASVDDYIRMSANAYDFAFNIVIVTIQKMILNNWKTINFREIFDGVN